MKNNFFDINSVGDFIETYTGKFFYLLNPKERDVDIIDIAHSLSQLCRYTGHTQNFYSVAEHSYFASHIIDEKYALEALLHDAVEVYMNDMSRPVKRSIALKSNKLYDNYKEIEQNIEKIIAKKYKLQFPFPEEVKKIDNIMLYLEAHQLHFKKIDKWNFPIIIANKNLITIQNYKPKEIEKRFLNRFIELTEKRKKK